MKRILWALVVGIAVLACTYGVYGRRARIQAAIWHWRHGQFAQVGSYRVPVPDRWLPQDYDENDMISLIDTDTKQSGDALANVNVIGIILLPKPADQGTSAALRWDRLKSIRVTNTDDKVISFEDERVLCSGVPINDAGRTSHAITLWCESTGRLSLSFTGDSAGAQRFYQIVAGIQKQP